MSSIPPGVKKNLRGGNKTEGSDRKGGVDQR